MSENVQNNEPQTSEVITPAEDTQTSPVDETNEFAKTRDEQQPTDQSAAEDTVDYSGIDTPEKATEILESKGIDYNALTEEYQANGDLSTETREKLEKLGFPKEAVDTYIEGQKVLVQKAMEDIASTVGGMDNMATIVEWAKANLSEAEKKAYDSIHEPVVLKVLLKDLEKRMNDEEGYIPQAQLQGGASEAPADYFESMHEVEEAINDPRYSSDPVYRSKIARKITASREAGVLEIK